MFGGHRPCGRGDIKFLICCEILREQVIRGSHVTMGWVTLIISHHPAKVGGHRRCARRDISFLVCQVT